MRCVAIGMIRIINLIPTHQTGRVDPPFSQKSRMARELTISWAWSLALGRVAAPKKLAYSAGTRRVGRVAERCDGESAGNKPGGLSRKQDSLNHYCLSVI